MSADVASACQDAAPVITAAEAVSAIDTAIRGTLATIDGVVCTPTGEVAPGFSPDPTTAEWIGLVEAALKDGLAANYVAPPTSGQPAL